MSSSFRQGTFDLQLSADGLRWVDDLLGSLAPAALLLLLYIAYVAAVAIRRPERCPPSATYLAHPPSLSALVLRLFVPLALILAMLASIIGGLIYTVEAAASGAVGATIYALARGQLNIVRLSETVRTVMRLTAMVFMLRMSPI